ncbi:hypothetical protein Dimus_024980, partial [Dionaea muscipula]
LNHSVMPRTSHSSSRGRGRSPTDRGGSHTSTPSASHCSSPSVELDDYIDDYRAIPGYDSMPTDSSHMPSSPEHPPTSSSGPPEQFLDGAG